MRLFFATDLHASDVCFRKFVNAITEYKVDIAILGGDLTGKSIVPIIATDSGEYIYEFLGQQWSAKTNEIPQVETRIRNSGAYFYHVSANEAKEIAIDKKRLNELFLKLTAERVEEWVRMADELLRAKNKKVYVTGGNDDSLQIDPILQKSDYVVYSEGKVINIDPDHEMISTGYSNMTPWKCPRDISEDELAGKIEAMVNNVKNMQNCIFNLHVPPIDSALDECPKLDASVSPPRPIMSGGSAVMYGGGSRAVRAAIEKHQPLLGLHGHIHESRGTVKLGKTLCVNPGSEYAEGIIRGAIVAYDKSKIKGYQLTSG